MKIASVTSREDSTLHVITEDGRVGTFDVRPYLESPAFLPLKDERETWPLMPVMSQGWFSVQR